jgi:hypothetical protein
MERTRKTSGVFAALVRKFMASVCWKIEEPDRRASTGTDRSGAWQVLLLTDRWPHGVVGTERNVSTAEGGDRFPLACGKREPLLGDAARP